MQEACDGSTEQQYPAANLWCVCALLVASQHRHLMLASLQAFLHQGEVHLCNPESF